MKHEQISKKYQNMFQNRFTRETVGLVLDICFFAKLVLGQALAD
jgi:hypothetical protein